MQWTDQQLDRLPRKDGFRLRGLDMTRLETFTDAAFAFATTLLVISTGTIPESYQELASALKDVPAFAASFASIASLWIMHRKWSQRYGLEDMLSILISFGLVFIMLVYVYPLKMIFSTFFAWISGGWLPTSFVLQNQSDIINLFIIYGSGFAVLSLMYVLLYYRAIVLGDILRLNALELLNTRMELGLSLVLSLTGLISACFAWLMPSGIDSFAGFIYMTLPFSMPITARRYLKELNKIKVI